MCDSFFSATLFETFSFRLVTVYILDVQETSRRCRRKFRIHTHTHTRFANVLVFTGFVHERASNG